MKNQNDLIISIVAIVVAAGAAIAFSMTARPIPAQPKVTAVPVADAQMKPGAVVVGNGLPGSGNTGSAPGGSAGRSKPGMQRV